MAFTRPPRVQGGGKQEIRAEHHNALARCIEELQNARVDYPQRTKRGSTGLPNAWTPTFRQVGEIRYVKFRLGLLNQMAADNWDEELEIGAEDTKWPVLNVTASDGKITGFEIALDDETPTEDQIAEDFPPDSFKIVLGVIDNLKGTMAVFENLETYAIEVFRQSRNPPAAGAEPFTRWWRWKVNQNTEGEYPFIT